jgi:UDP-galactopyranose mutase
MQVRGPLKVDYLIVGSGLTGAVIARSLTDAGCDVLVVERRPHVGGNVYDYTHPSDIRVHAYGPHYFRTNSDKIWRFVNRFATVYKYEAVVKAYVDGQYENWPVTDVYVHRIAGDHWEPESTGAASNFEEACLQKMPRQVYETLVKGYTEKQWGVPARTLSVELALRVHVNEDDEERLTPQHKYQGIPREGYTSMINNMLEGIPVVLNINYLDHRESYQVQKTLVFTGPIDEFFSFDLGRLAYRGQKRELVYLSHVDYAMPYGQVNNPGLRNGPHIRTVEWKHMMPKPMAEAATGTVLTFETPFTPTDPNEYEYPFPDESNAQLYQLYRVRANSIPQIVICGRLGEYRYYDMDQAIGRALMLALHILKGSSDG